MGAVKHPKKFTAEWWEERKRVTAGIAARHQRQGFKATATERMKSKHDEHAALYGRDPRADETYTPPRHWND